MPRDGDALCVQIMETDVVSSSLSFLLAVCPDLLNGSSDAFALLLINAERATNFFRYIHKA